VHGADPACKLNENVLCFTVLHEARTHVEEVYELDNNHLCELVLGKNAAHCKAERAPDKSSGCYHTPPLAEANEVHALQPVEPNRERSKCKWVPPVSHNAYCNH